jgi:hypothetical protein
MSRKLISGTTPDGATLVFVVEGNRTLGYGLYKVIRFTGRMPLGPTHDDAANRAQYYDLEGARLTAKAENYPSMPAAVTAAEQELAMTVQMRAGVDPLPAGDDGLPETEIRLPVFTWTVTFVDGASFRLFAVDEDQALDLARRHPTSPTLVEAKATRGWEPWS